MTMSDGVKLLYSVLDAGRYRYRDEKALQDGLAARMTAAKVAFRREVAVAGGRIDFLVGSIGVEVKVGGSSDAVQSQLRRYADDPRMTEFLLVTTRPTHRAVAREVKGKPVSVCVIGGLSL